MAEVGLVKRAAIVKLRWTKRAAPVRPTVMMETPSMTRAAVAIAVLVMLASAAVPARAQSEATLEQFFEGKQVVVLMDMPGTKSGVDIYPQRPNPLDAKSYGSRMKGNPVSLRNGDPVMITTVKVKDKSIEFQLGGGGFGTFWDASDTSVHFTPEEKSQREKDLENQIANTDDGYEKSRLQRQLDDVRRQRERDDRRNRELAQQDAERRKEEVAGKKVQGGSRFNLIYSGKVPPGITPHDVMMALSQYVSFPAATFGDASIPNSQAAPAAANATAPGAQPGMTVVAVPVAPPSGAPTAGDDPVKQLQKGMHQQDVQTLLGAPTKESDEDHDGITVHSEVFERKDSTVLAEFVNGVLVKYTVSVH